MSSSRRCLLLLEKCKNMKQLKKTHAQVITIGLLNNSFALSRLLAFCSDPVRGSLNHGWKLFQQIKFPTVCICNTMIKAFLLKGELVKTIEIYTHMCRIRILPDNYTLPYVLKASATLKMLPLGELFHGHALKLGFSFDPFVSDGLILLYSVLGNMNSARFIFDEISKPTVVSWTLMIDGYSKQGNVDSARLLFDEAPIKDRGLWGCMISGYVQNNCFKEGLQMFRLIQSTDLKPDEGIFVSILCACAHLGAVDIGMWVHLYLERLKFASSVRLGTALIDMYAKCGILKLARKLFDQMHHRDIVCWNAMISGMAMNGDGEGALKLFSEMEKAKIRPDDITFLAIFTACSYSNMTSEGLEMLYKMHITYGIEPKSEHYGCIVSFLSRAGLLKEANEIIQSMSNSSGNPEEAFAWRALMSACCSFRQTKLAEAAAEKLFGLEHHSGVYVLLSNLYAADGKHDDARRIRKRMIKKRVYKTPGCSLVEIKGVVHEFVAGEETHPAMDEVHIFLESVSKQMHNHEFENLLLS